VISNPFSVTPNEVASAAVMMKQGSSLVLVVEGESDEILISRHTDRSKLGFVIASGKNNAIAVAQILDSDAVSAEIRVLVDRDLDGARGAGDRVITTTYWDLDSEVLGSTDILHQLYLAFKRERYPHSLQRLMHETAKVSSPLSSLLVVSHRRGLGLAAARLSLSAVEKDSPLEAQVRSLLKQALDRTNRTGIGDLPVDSLIEEVVDHARSISYSLDGHQGHHLHIALARMLGKGVKPDLVQSFVWASLTLDQFRATPVASKLDDWCNDFGEFIWISAPGEVAA
jgi:hypothetical protein